MYVLGVDWFEPFDYKTHSTGVVFLKCLDFEDRFQGVATNIFPLMIIQGPKEPHNMVVYLRIVADEFKKFGPGSSGMRVLDSATNEEFNHIVVLGGILGDTPARQKFGGFAGHGAHLGCPYCVMNSTPVWGHRIRYWLGFSKPVAVDL